MERKVFQCDLCRAKYSQKAKLNFHLKSKHTMEKVVSVSCTLCSKKFATKRGRLDHEKKTYIWELKSILARNVAIHFVPNTDWTDTFAPNMETNFSVQNARNAFSIHILCDNTHQGAWMKGTLCLHVKNATQTTQQNGLLTITQRQNLRLWSVCYWI